MKAALLLVAVANLASATPTSPFSALQIRQEAETCPITHDFDVNNSSANQGKRTRDNDDAKEGVEKGLASLCASRFSQDAAKLRECEKNVKPQCISVERQHGLDTELQKRINKVRGCILSNMDTACPRIEQVVASPEKPDGDATKPCSITHGFDVNDSSANQGKRTRDNDDAKEGVEKGLATLCASRFSEDATKLGECEKNIKPQCISVERQHGLDTELRKRINKVRACILSNMSSCPRFKQVVASPEKPDGGATKPSSTSPQQQQQAQPTKLWEEGALICPGNIRGTEKCLGTEEWCNGQGWKEEKLASPEACKALRSKGSGSSSDPASSALAKPQAPKSKEQQSGKKPQLKPDDDDADTVTFSE